MEYLYTKILARFKAKEKITISHVALNRFLNVSLVSPLRYTTVDYSKGVLKTVRAARR